MIQNLYRYVQVNYAPSFDEFDNPIGIGSTGVEMHTFKVIKQTPKGVWINDCTSPSRKKFVNLTARKKYACLTEADALDSFIARKNRHISILTAQLKSANKALYKAAMLKEFLIANKFKLDEK